MKVFISSVQKAFKKELRALYNFFKKDPVLRSFFEPLIFENLPASKQAPDKVYIDEVGAS